MTPITTVVSVTESAWAAATAISAGFAAIASAYGCVRLRGTTLSAPAAWCTAAATVLAAGEAFTVWRGGFVQPMAAPLLRYLAVVGVFCPIMAVLGSKRPQNRGWQWVVLSLWGILAVPAAQAWAANTGDRLELPAAWQAMLWGLAGVGLMNYLPTRYALHALGFSSGQLLLSSEFLLDWTPVSPSPARLAGSVVLAICAISVHWRSPEPRHDLCTFRWLAFRDGWGAFWGLRVFHRVNHTAELGNWPIRLSWAGFVNSKDRKIIVADADPKIALQVRQVMDSLLWRFERASED